MLPTQSKTFSGVSYFFVSNFGTKREADANAKLQRRSGMNVRIWKWKRESDGMMLYAEYIRRRKNYDFGARRDRSG